MLELTLFMSPSEDRTSQTIMIHQLIFIILQTRAYFPDTGGLCGDVISMRCVEQGHAAYLGNRMVYFYGDSYLALRIHARSVPASIAREWR
jgi:hypothetical protein